MIGGGPEGGIFKSTDAGKKWTKLTKGLPKDDVGKIALGVDPKNPTRVYAMISAKIARGGRGGGGGRGGEAAPPAPAAAPPRQRLISTSRASTGRTIRARTWARVGTGRAPAAGRGGRGAVATAEDDEENDEAERGLSEAEAGDAQGTASPQPPQELGRRRRAWYRGGGAAYYFEFFVDPHRPDWIWSINTNLDVSKDGGKTWQHDRASRTAPACTSITTSSLRSGRSESHPDRQRRRRLRDLRRRADVPLLREPADHAVLPRVGGQREAVLQRVRRHAGQLVRVRPRRQRQPLGRAHERLVRRRRRRRVPDAQRSRGSEYRLRLVAERQHLAPRPAHRDLAQHPAARRGAVHRRRRRSRRARIRRRSASAPTHRRVPLHHRACRPQATAAGRQRAQRRPRRRRAAPQRRRRGGEGGRARQVRTQGRGGGGRGRRRARSERRSPELGRALHRQPAQSAAALLGEPVRASQRRSRRQLDARSARTSRAT